MARRAAKEQQQKRGSAQSDNGKKSKTCGESRSYYRTGYTDRSKAKQRWNRFKTKSAERKNRPKKQTSDMRSIFSSLWQFLKSPIDGVLNPKGFSMPQMILLAAIEGALIGMGLYFVATGASRSWFRALANIVGFGGAAGYKMLLNILM
ncbi:MAG: hypothetical protein LUD03_00930, partial [Firmicutes bacterium]|nr:hypothetical protein [Bacillota bacterium]